MTFHWEKTEQGATQWLMSQISIGYRGEVVPDGKLWLVMTWR